MLDPIRKRLRTWGPASRDGSIPHPAWPQTGVGMEDITVVVIILVLTLASGGDPGAVWADVVLYLAR